MTQHPAPASPKGRPLTVKIVAQYILGVLEIHGCVFRVRSAASSTARTTLLLVSNITTNSAKALWLTSQMACSMGFWFYCLTQMPLWYYCSLSGAMATYVVSLFMQLKMLAKNAAHSDKRVSAGTLLRSESTMLFGATLLHIITAPSVLKLFSFAVYSWVNLASYVLKNCASCSSFTISLMAVVSCLEPLLLSAASYADYMVVVLYLFETLWCKTLLVYAVILTYICLRRMEYSELSRLAFYNLVCYGHRLALGKWAPSALGTVADSAKKLAEAMVAPEDVLSAHLIAQSADTASVRTRATSVFFERISLIEDC
ncbi:hypothetical protein METBISCDRAFT_27194 [Metschnikowia bicuspidata]|uniref:Transmembrane protein n=1 Tax=Metschnikowia bicuspidata TaxID=27322 RepID=A0A4P9ZFH4_9ASCO|nr:hypothetical protein METBISCDRAFT_27194 [Metschnikowia bicuspidata]